MHPEDLKEWSYSPYYRESNKAGMIFLNSKATAWTVHIGTQYSHAVGKYSHAVGSETVAEGNYSRELDEEVKMFIEDNIELIEANDFDKLYFQIMPLNISREVTRVLLSVGVNPKHYLSSVPEYLQDILR